MTDWPTSLEINAWTNDNTVTSALASSAKRLASNTSMAPQEQPMVLTPDEIDPADWRDPQVGWGLVLAEGATIPDPLQELLKQRPGSPVLRYQPGILTHLLNPASDKDIPIIDGPSGTKDPTSLPYYLLIYGSPKIIPWELQYALSASGCFVGRLDLEGEQLENYVDALLNDWSEATAAIEQAVVWSVVQDNGGITSLMRTAVGERVFNLWQADTNAAFTGNIQFLDGKLGSVTNNQLTGVLKQRQPALIVTTSHGRTGPLDKPAEMLERLGVLVDQLGDDLDPASLLGEWQPGGAVWYAHACCSAGSSAQTQFDKQFSALIPAGSDVDRVLKGVAALGSQIAPLPRALLGAKKPLRAFIGHVEPTFDIALRDGGTGQHLTNLLRGPLYRDIYNKPVGYAFAPWANSGTAFRQPYDKAMLDLNKNLPDARRLLLGYQLLARDRANTVILGDPTVALPKLP